MRTKITFSHLFVGENAASKQLIHCCTPNMLLLPTTTFNPTIIKGHKNYGLNLWSLWKTNYKFVQRHNSDTAQKQIRITEITLGLKTIPK